MSIIIPSSPEDRKLVLNALKEISNSYTRSEAEKDFVKETINELADNVEIEKKHIRQLAQIYHRQNLSEVRDRVDTIEALYEAIVK
jgi:uncharacterized membrane protein YgaE (UPF0421/DUF939 family)